MTKEDIEQAFSEFKDGSRQLYFITPCLETFTAREILFRKLSNNEVAILAWIERSEAEKWMAERRIERCRAQTISYPMLKALLESERQVSSVKFELELA